MKLRTRILACLALTLVCLVGGISLLSSRLLLKSYADLERQDTESNVQRARLAFDQCEADLHVKSVDWAAWDDAYKFLKDHNSAFIKSNMVDSSVASMQLDGIIYLDVQGKIFCEKTVHRFKEIAPTPATEVVSAIGLSRILSAGSNGRKGISGTINLRRCPMSVSVRPVLTSAATGPSRGWLIFCRYFEADALKELSKRTRLELRAPVIGRDRFNEVESSIRNSLGSLGSIATRPRDNNLIDGVTIIPDVAGHPLLMMHVTQPRSIYAQGLSSSRNLMQLILIAGILFSVVVMIALEMFAFSRLSHLTIQVKRIGRENGIRHVDLQGRDELALLASTINRMLETQYESDEKLRAHTENLENLVRERTAQIERQAFHDELTGLPNRALFMTRLGAARRQSHSNGMGIAVLFIDLDNFKYVNDTLGHQAGDDLLIEMAQRLTEAVRPEDTVARLGGDEFTVLIDNAPNDECAILVAQRIIERLSIPVAIGDRIVSTPASIGVAFDGEQKLDPDTLMKNADAAMYEAKAHGKASYAVFDATMNDRLAERLEIEIGLRSAIQNEQLVLAYQPLISLTSGKMVGFEALLRWNHPLMGSIPPSKFIPIAEDTGLILPIGYWVLETACRQMKAWIDAEPSRVALTMNINVTGKQLQKPDVVDRVSNVLEATGVPVSCIKLEITESVMMGDMEYIVAKLHELKALGVRLALDDFGTGYSSIANLDAFPLDTVKIDRAFIQQLNAANSASGGVVEAIIAMSKALNLDVTGEGVETGEQMEALRSLGCDIGQGYLFDKPLSPAAIEAIFEADVKNEIRWAA